MSLSRLGSRFAYLHIAVWASLVAQLVKNPPAIWEIWVWSLDWEYPLEGLGNPLQYSCLENPHGQRSLAGYSPWGHRVRHNLALSIKSVYSFG